MMMMTYKGAYVTCEQASAAKYRNFAENGVGPAAAQDNVTSQSDRLRITYSRRIDQQKPVYPSQQNAPVSRRRVSLYHRAKLPNPLVQWRLLFLYPLIISDYIL